MDFLGLPGLLGRLNKAKVKPSQEVSRVTLFSSWVPHLLVERAVSSRKAAESPVSSVTSLISQIYLLPALVGSQTRASMQINLADLARQTVPVGSSRGKAKDRTKDNKQLLVHRPLLVRRRLPVHRPLQVKLLPLHKRTQPKQPRVRKPRLAWKPLRLQKLRQSQLLLLLQNLH